MYCVICFKSVHYKTEYFNKLYYSKIEKMHLYFLVQNLILYFNNS